MNKMKSAIVILGCLLLCILSSVITYLSLSVSGVIGVEPIALEFSVLDATKEYDGEELVASEITLDSGDLLEGHTPKVSFYGSQVIAGYTTSNATISILDEDGYDVSNQYSIKVNSGLLTVTKKPITLTVKSSDLVYNGDEMDDSAISVTTGSLVLGHKVVSTITYSTSGTTVDIAPDIYDAVGNKVTDSYSISGQLKNVKITQRDLTVAPIDATFEYDGDTHTSSSYEITDGSLVAGHTLAVEFGGGSSEVGPSDGTITKVTVYDSRRNNVTRFYSITHSDVSNITITPRRLVVVTASAEKPYDGTPLEAKSYYIAANTKLMEGDYLECKNYAKITQFGQIENTCDITVTNGYTNSTDNYDIQPIYGQLKVSKAILVLTAKSYKETYNSSSPFTMAHADADYTALDLEEMYGLCEGDIISFNYKGSINTVGSTNNEITDVKILNTAGLNVTESYQIICKAGKLEYISESTLPKITVTCLSGTKEYDGTPLSYVLTTSPYMYVDTGLASIEGLPTGYHYAFNYSLTSQITTVGKVANTIDLSTFKIATSDNPLTAQDVTDQYDIVIIDGTLEVTRALLQITAKDNTKKYDGTPLTMKKATGYYTKADLEEYYGLASTDDIQFNYKGEITEVGTCKNMIDSLKIVNVLGQDVTSCYQIILYGGILEVTPASLPIIKMVALSDSKPYDGTALTKTKALSYVGTGLSSIEGLPTGYQYTFNYSGTITDAGTCENEIVDYHIYNISDPLNPIEVTSLYDIEIVNGSLTITKIDIAIKFVNTTVSKIYDGKAMEISTDDVEFVVPNSNLSITSVVADGSYSFIEQSSDGKIGIKSATIYDTTQGRDVTMNYNIDCSSKATLEFNPRTLLLTLSNLTTSDGASFTKIQDALVNSVAVSSSTPLVEGDYIDPDSIEVDGVSTSIGTKAVTVTTDSIAILRVVGNTTIDMTAYYTITSGNALLTVLDI